MFNHEINILRDTYRRLLRRNAKINLIKLTRKTHPADLAEVFRHFSHEEQIEISFESSMNLEKINCFINQGVSLIKKVYGKRVELKLKGLKSDQRHRLNCTIINKENIYWFGKMVKRVN